MANGNDTRIVEMQFQNRDFEKNISQSQKSLEKFKKELNFDDTSKGMDKFTKSLKSMKSDDGFGVMADNLQKLTDKFTGLGTVSEFVLSRIRRGLESMGDKVISFMNSMTTVQAQAGFTKYESLNKAVQTLKSATGKEEKEIYGVLERLTKYTDETSYDFSQGVTSISQLVSSGAASLSKAEKIVEGFYNFAAKAGADTQTASAALQYSWTQSMQRGYLDYANWKELSNRSLGTRDLKETLLETAVAMGKVTKEGDKYFAKSKKGKKIEINTTNLWNDSLQQQWLTTDICNAAMLKYADTTTEFGQQAYAAAQRCTTFTDALNAWKDMLATGWMQTYRTVFGDLGDAMQLFSGICNKVSDALSGLVEARNRVLKGWKGFGGKDSLWGMLVGEFESPDEGVFFEGRKGILDLIIGTGDLIQDAFWDMVKDSMSEADRSQLEMWAGNTDAIMNLLAQEGMLEGASEEELAELRNYIDESFGERGILYGYLGSKLADATAQVQEFVQSVYEWFSTADDKGVTRFEKIKSVVQSIFNTIKFIGEIIGGVFDFIGEIFAEDQLGGAVDAILTFFNTLAGAITGTENDISKSGGITEFFHNLAEAVKPVTSFLSESVKTIMAFFTSLISGGEKADGQTNTWEKINEFFATIASILSNIGQPIIDTITNIFNALSGGEKKADDGKEHTSFFTTLLDILVKVSSVIGKVIGFIGNLISGFITWGKESGFFAAAWEKIKSVVSAVWETIKKIAKPFAEFFGSIGSILQDLFSNGFDADSLARAGEGFKQAFSKLTGDLGSMIKPAWEKIKTFFTNLFGNLKELTAPIRAKIREFFQSIFGIFKSESKEAVSEVPSVAEVVTEALGAGEDHAIGEQKNIFQRIIDWVKTGFENIKGFFQNLGAAFTQPGTFGEKVVAVFGQIIDFFKNCNLQTILLALLGGLTVAAIVALVTKIVKLVKKVGGALVTIADSITNGFKLKGTSDKVESFGTKILKFAAAMALLTGCVYFLANMELGKALQGIGFLAAIMTAMALFMKSIMKSMKDVSWKQVGTMALALYAVGAAVAKMISALKPIMELSGEGAWEQWGRMMLSLVVVLGSLGLFFKAVDKMDINFKKMSGVISLALGIWLLVKTLMSITKLGWGEKNGYALEKMGGALVAIVASLVAVGLAVRKAPKKTFRDIGLMLAGLSLLLFTLKGISNMTDQQLIQMGKGFAGLIAGLLILTAGIALINKKVGSAKGSGMKELAYATAAMAILVFALKPLADMGWGQLGKMGAAFGGLIVGLLILTVGLAKINEKSIGLKGSGLGSLLVAALGMWAIVMALKPIADMEWVQLGKMGAVFGGLIAGLLILVGGMRLIEKKFGGGMKKSLGFGAMLTLVLGIVGLIEVLKPVANMEWGDLGKMGAVFAAIVAGLAIAIGVIQGTSKKLSSAIGSVLMIVSFVFAVWELIGVLSLVNNLTDDQLIRMGATFAVLITGMAVAMGMASKVSKNGKKALAGIATMAALAGLIYVLGLVMKDTAGLGWEHMLAFSGSVMLVCLAMIPIANAIEKLSKIKLTGGIKGLAFLGVALAAVSAAVVIATKQTKGINWKTLLATTAGILIVAIAMIPLAAAIKILGNIDIKKGLTGIVLLVAAVAAISLVIGALAPLVAEGIGSSMQTLAEHLDHVGTMMSSFSKNMGNVDEGNIDKASRVIDKLKDVIASLTGMAGRVGDIDAFAIGLWEITVAVSTFHDLTKDIQGPENNGAIKILEWFRDNAGTLSGIEFGDMPMAIAELAAGLWIFDDLTKDFPTLNEGEKLPAVQLIETLAGMQEMMNSLGNVGSFGVKVGRLGSGLNNFITSTSSIGTGADESPGVKLLQALANSAAGIQILTGLDLSGLADSMTLLGGGMAIYADAATQLGQMGADGTEVPDVSAAVGILQQVVDQLSGKTGELTLPTLPSSEQSTNFGTQMAALAGGLKQFIQASDGISDNTQAGLDAIGFLASIKTDLTDDLINFVTQTGSKEGWDETSLAAFGTDLGVLASGLTGFIGASEGITGNTQKGLDAIGFLEDINGKLTDDLVKVITFFPDKGLTNTMLAQLGEDLVVLASGLSKFCSVEVPENIDESLSLLDYFSTLNQKLTDAKIDELAQTIAAYMAPIESADVSGDALVDYASQVAELAGDGNKQSPMSVFTYGIIQLGKALQEFATDINKNGYFDKSYETPLENAKKAIEFFREQASQMPAIPTGLITFFVGYKKDLGDLAPSIKYLGEALAQFGEAVTGAYNAGNFDTDLVTNSINAIGVLVDCFVKIATAVDEIYDRLVKYDGFDGSLGSAANSVIESYSTWLDKGKAIRQLGQMLGYIMKSMMDLEYVDIDGKTIIDTFMSLMQSMKNGFETYDISADDIGQMMTAFDALTKLVDTFDPAHYPQYQKPITNYLAYMLEDVESVLFGDGSVLETEVGELTALINSVAESMTALTAFSTQYQSPSEETINAFVSDFSKILGAMVTAAQTVFNEVGMLDAYGDVDLETINAMADIMTKIASVYQKMIVHQPQLSNVGVMTVEEIASGITGSSGLILQAINDLMDSVSLDTLQDLFFNKFNNAWNLSLIDAAKAPDAGDTVEEIVGHLGDLVENSGENQQWSFQDVGFYLAAGLALGVSSGTYLIEQACRAAVAAARAAAMAEADAHSPSLVFAAIGGFLSQGMAIGITDGQGEVVRSMTDLTDEVINGATSTMATISGLMSQEIDANPTITPVLDMSNVKSGANYINGVLNGDYNLSAGIGGDYASNSVPRSGRSSGEYQGTDLTGINAKISDLGSRITALGNQMSNLQIVMDSGELVGSISGGVSSKIGRKSTYNRRRNA